MAIVRGSENTTQKCDVLNPVVLPGIKAVDWSAHHP
jgi:hypothetical protein